jgi:hypothetical protein
MWNIWDAHGGYCHESCCSLRYHIMCSGSSVLMFQRIVLPHQVDLSCWRRQQDPLKCVFFSTRIHGITSQKIAAFKEWTFSCYFCTCVYDLYWFLHSQQVGADALLCFQYVASGWSRRMEHWHTDCRLRKVSNTVTWCCECTRAHTHTHIHTHTELSSLLLFSQSCIIHSSTPHKVQQTYWIPNLLPNNTEIWVHNVHAILKHMSQWQRIIKYNMMNVYIQLKRNTVISQ